VEEDPRRNRLIQVHLEKYPLNGSGSSGGSGSVDVDVSWLLLLLGLTWSCS